MEIKKFYDFRSKLVSSTFQTHAVGLNKDKNENSEYYDQHMLILGDYSGIAFPVVFKQMYGEKLQDVLDTGWGGLYLISDRIKTAFEDNHLTGWKTFEIKVFTKKGQEVEGYHVLTITGRGGKIDYLKTEIIEKRLVPEGPLGKYYKGLYVGLDDWDGSDFFLPERHFGTIITSKVADVLKKGKFTNIKIENLMDIETPDFALPNVD
jgi:hypothetical protein